MAEKSFQFVEEKSRGVDWRRRLRQKSGYEAEQMAHLCKSEQMADVEFVFDRGGEITKVPARSLTLSMVSKVFQKELTYSALENVTEKRSKTLKVVEIKDEMVEIDAFKTMILFCNNSCKNVRLTGDSALPILYIAMLYMIEPLEAFCVNFLLEHLDRDVTNIFAILQFCMDYGVDNLNLMEKCMTVLQADTWILLPSQECFTKISDNCLMMLLGDEFLEAREINLFNATISWARAACKKAGANPNDGKTLRSKLGEALKLIRFPLMSVKEFAESVVPTGILSAEEQRDILLMIGGESPVGTPISVSALPRGRKLNADSTSTLEGSCILSDQMLYQIDSTSSKLTEKSQFQTRIQIDGFPSFVSSKATHVTEGVRVKEAEWRIVVELSKYCGESKRFITENLSSAGDAEFLGSLGIYICPSVHENEVLQCNIDAVLRFKRTCFSKKFYLSTNPTKDAKWGFETKIEDILNENNGYLTGDSLEMLIEVTIS